MKMVPQISGVGFSMQGYIDVLVETKTMTTSKYLYE